MSVERVLVGGSRRPTPEMVTACRRYVAALPRPESVVVAGGAGGIDTVAEQTAKLFSIPVEVFPPDYERYPPQVAPLRRNQAMALVCHRAVFFWDGVSTGTWHAMKEVRKRGKPLEVFVLGHKVEDPSTLKPPDLRRARREVELL
jgi:hypothetical protein